MMMMTDMTMMLMVVVVMTKRVVQNEGCQYEMNSKKQDDSGNNGGDGDDGDNYDNDGDGADQKSCSKWGMNGKRQGGVRPHLKQPIVEM